MSAVSVNGGAQRMHRDGIPSERFPERADKPHHGMLVGDVDRIPATGVSPAMLGGGDDRAPAPSPQGRDGGVGPEDDPIQVDAHGPAVGGRVEVVPMPQPVATPAFRWTRSRPPNRSTTAATAARLSARNETSHGT